MSSFGEVILGDAVQAGGGEADRHKVISLKISNLVAAQKAIKKTRDDIKKELKNERRKRGRILRKAKGLSNNDLSMILAERNHKAGGTSRSPADQDGGDAASGSGSASSNAP